MGRKKVQRPRPNAKPGARAVDPNKIRLSVVIPAYDLEDCIADCLDSVLAQDVGKIEVIVVDDRSTDGTWDTICSYAKRYEQIVPIQLPKNAGPSAARNAALDVARGEWVHFCDGDDSVPEGAYQELLRVAEEEHADLVTGNYSRRYPSENGAVRPFSHYCAPTGKERCFESGNTTLWNKLYRRSLIEKGALRFDESLPYYEDYLFYHMYILQAPKMAYTDMYVYTYTEPVTRPFNGSIRYANLECAVCLDKAWRTIFASDISKKDEALWRQAFYWNLAWYFDWSWKLIQDVQVKRQAFQILRELICWVQDEAPFCGWLEPGREQAFRDVFRVDFPTFCGISFEDYLLHLAMQDGIRPRAPSPAAVRELKGLTCAERDEKLQEETGLRLGELWEAYQKSYTDRKAWKDHYWDLLDGLVNDCWRQIGDPDKKDELFLAIREKVDMLRTRNALCGLSTPDDVQRFRQIFCVDNAALQVLTSSRYMMVCSPRGGWSQGGGGASGGGGYSAPDSIAAFVAACRNGQAGMRAILESVKGWLKYKFSRGKR